ncbi:nucleotidyltransferase domain-containing protein [Streptomyces sp. ME18-1-4]|uniref:nucleotidyltransferase domain-containing protein n=1 Tax=Streptomyces sp. ME18-1-4 TaxID=3028685 RepID=UPI0029AD79CE|nr:nucleotidyltransferase domain-containing protein [Streptomyces sp. ME18-1-4]MDX3246914.1 nucleotidyltransferase domain-containing protein [Streptomyces sp. ME18-1-4]
MKLHGGRVVDAGGVSPEREAEMRQVVDRVTRWCENRSDVAGLLLVGSCARGAARPDSDVDLVLLSTATDRYAADDAWAGELSLGELVRVQEWGPITEWRHVTASGLEVEVGVGSPDWARADPVDDGTRRVVTDGARLLYDPAGILQELIQACA